MTGVVTLSIICGALLVMLVAGQWSASIERKQWAIERRDLVNRAIARHAGEVRALDGPQHVKPGPLDNHVDRPTPVGL